jgi:DNA-binding CsgD family transcriptional regulator
MPETSRLTGREAELTLLTTYVDNLVAGTGHATLIEGEPGIGKSSLARATARTAEHRGCQTFWSAADELGQALPLRPILDAFQTAGRTEKARLETIRRLLLGEFENTLEPVPVAAEQAFALVSELCEEAPTVLVVDDLQWADTVTIGLWERLARSVHHLPLLLIGVMRPVPERLELLAVQRVVGAKGTIKLLSLSDGAVADLVTELSDGRPGESLLRVVAEAAGNPLYLTELVAALSRSDRLAVSESGLVEVTSGPVPQSLLSAIVNRLDFLPGEVRETLKAAALLGVEFQVADLAVVRNCRVADLVIPIDQARTGNVLVEAGEKLSFRHPLIRTALYEAIPLPLRSAWHNDAARALSQAGAPVHRVARQLLQAFATPGAGSLDEPLLDWLADASPTLVAQAPGTAVELLREACRRSSLVSARGGWFAARLAEAHFRSGNSTEGEVVAGRAMSVVTNPDVLVDLHWTMAQCRVLLGKTGQSLESIDRAITLPGVSEQQRARLLVLAARAHRDQGEVAVAGRIASDALETAEQVGDTWALAWALHVLIVVAVMRGDVATALPLFERALDVVGDDPAFTDLGLLLQINKSVALGDLDRFEEAKSVATRVRRQAGHTGNLVRLAQARCALGELLFEAGEWDAAQDEVEAIADDVKDPGTHCCDRGIAALIAFHRGDAATARRHLEAASASAGLIGSRVVSSLVLARSLDHEIAGDLDEALAVCLAFNAEELDEIEDLLPEAARLAALTDEIVMLKDVVAQVVALAQRSQVPHRLGAVAYCRGLLSGSSSLLLLAAEQYGDAGRPLLQAKALEAAADELAGGGDRGAARSAFVRADDLYDRLGAGWDLARLRAAFRRYGIRRGPRNRHRQVRSGWDSLTPSEANIARLVAGGSSNREIAERLVLSTRTVESHVSHILAKLGVRSRVEIARHVAN